MLFFLFCFVLVEALLVDPIFGFHKFEHILRSTWFDTTSPFHSRIFSIVCVYSVLCISVSGLASHPYQMRSTELLLLLYYHWLHSLAPVSWFWRDIWVNCVWIMHKLMALKTTPTTRSVMLHILHYARAQYSTWYPVRDCNHCMTWWMRTYTTQWTHLHIAICSRFNWYNNRAPYPYTWNDKCWLQRVSFETKQKHEFKIQSIVASVSDHHLSHINW